MTGSCPDSAFHGIITAVGIVLSMIISGVTTTTTGDGGSNFAISVLDASNESTGQFAVNTIGKYSGTTAFGFNSLGDGVTLEISADGNWSVTIAPISAAPAPTRNRS